MIWTTSCSRPGYHRIIEPAWTFYDLTFSSDQIRFLLGLMIYLIATASTVLERIPLLDAPGNHENASSLRPPKPALGPKRHMPDSASQQQRMTPLTQDAGRAAAKNLELSRGSLTTQCTPHVRPLTGHRRPPRHKAHGHRNQAQARYCNEARWPLLQSV